VINKNPMLAARIAFPAAMHESSPLLLFGLFRRRPCLLPTWRGWLLILVICGAGAVLAARNACTFLAINDPVPGEALVVEGWGPDLLMRDAIAEFHRGQYQEMFTTGGPIEKSAMFTDYKSYAELSATTLQAMGFDPAHLHAVPAASVQRDRTYASALALKNWLREHGMKVKRITLISLGPHSRRSRLLFEKAFGDDAQIGVIAVSDGEFDPKRWWTTSEGFRTVTGEMIAYIYARLFFHPAGE
jgi:hypothetical protein